MCIRDRSMDVFIAGVARSGSTLVANLMTTPPDRWLIVEPGITRGDMSEQVRIQAERFGIRISGERWRAESNAEERFEKLLIPHLSRLKSWGVKEVNPAGYDRLLALFNPRKVVLVVRDIGDAAISMLEKQELTPRAGQDEEWLAKRLCDSARAVMKLAESWPGERTCVVHYERFVADPMRKSLLEEWLSWPLTGDPNRCMDIFARDYEVDRHDREITDRSVDRRHRETSTHRLAFAKRVTKSMRNFQETFGYSD